MKSFIFRTLYALASFFICLSCASDEERASSLLQQAQSSYESGYYNQARVLIDSIETTYPKAIKMRRQSMLLGYKIDLEIAQNISQISDSLLGLLKVQLDQQLTKFTYTKSEYDDMGRYIYKGSEAENNASRSYLHAAVDDYGVHHLISSYTGRKINHTAVRLTAPDGTSCSTENIEYNDGTNYHYNVRGTHYEAITFIGERDGGVLGFIAMHASDALTAKLIHKKGELSVKITSADRKGMVETFHLAHLIKEKIRLTAENRVSKDKIEYLEALIKLKEENSNQK